MTKRFTLAYEKEDWWAVKDGDITLWKEEVIATLNEQDQRIQELESLFPSKTCKWMDKENIAIRCDKYKDFRVCGVYKSCFEEGT